MNKPIENLKVQKAVDSIQQRLTDYACAISYADLSTEVVHAVKTRVIDTLGALLAGFYGEPCIIARNLAAQIPNSPGVSIIGTRMKTTPDMAAFVNGTTARYVELNDFYYRPGSGGGHPSDVMAPLFAAAEHAGTTSGRDFITAVALAYEIYLRIADTGVLPGFDTTNYMCLGAATAAGKLIGLTPQQLAHCIAMAAVPNNALLQSRSGFLSMWKEVAAGQGGRAAVFAALLAQAGMEGPHLPFEGKAGWCDHIAKKRFALDTMGGRGTPFKITETSIKERPCCASTISSALAAEGVQLQSGIAAVQEIIVEVYEKAKRGGGTGDHHWHPDTRDTADHSIPYVVATTLMRGKVTPDAFDESQLWNPELRALMQKITVVENDEFTKAHKSLPAWHRSRVTVVTAEERAVGETGIGDNDVMASKGDARIEDKFRASAEDFLGSKRTRSILDRLWNLDDMQDIAEIPAAFVFH